LVDWLEKTKQAALLATSIALHQPAESIALLVAFLKSNLSQQQIIKYLSVFSLVGMVGVFLGTAASRLTTRAFLPIYTHSSSSLSSDHSDDQIDMPLPTRPLTQHVSVMACISLAHFSPCLFVSCLLTPLLFVLFVSPSLRPCREPVGVGDLGLGLCRACRGHLHLRWVGGLFCIYYSASYQDHLDTKNSDLNI
jgi:hypothetical protein